MTKVLILTLEQGENYGGMLQAYALQKQLDNMDVESFSTWSLKHRWLGEREKYLVRSLLRLIRPSSTFDLSPKDKLLVRKYTQAFINANVRVAPVYRSSQYRKSLKNYDAIIVGSDQVWRAKYVDVSDYLLEYEKNRSDILKISYAASFGKDDLSEYSKRLIRKSAKLARKFNAISVREDSGVHVCKNRWGVDAIQVVDPTLLLSKKEYIQLVKDDFENIIPSAGELFSYVLDKSGGKQHIIDKVATKLNLEVFEIMPPLPSSRLEFIEKPDKFILPPVAQWLKSFTDAKFVVTDSFHGCAFSIIFNKPFIAIGNEGRGLARFTSLLKLFNLEDRLVLAESDITDDLIAREIDWAAINKKVEFERKRSFEYLKKNLPDIN